MQLQAITFKGLPWGFGAIFAAVGLAAASPGWWFLAVQHYRLATYLPVTGKVEEARVIRSGDDYEPLIRYSYTVNGHRYDGRRVSAVGNFTQTGTWAWDIVARFPAGGKATVWYSARNPSSSFIVRDASYAPHFVAIFGFVFLLVGVWAMLQSFVGRTVFATPERGRNGWFALRQEVSNRQAFRLFLVATVAWYGYTAIVFGDYWVLSEGHIYLLGIAAPIFVFGLGLPLLVQTCRNWRLLHDFTDAQVWSDRQFLQTGSKVRLRLSQPVCRPLLIDELSLSAVCMRNDRNTSGAGVSYAPPSVACRVQERLAVNRQYSRGGEISVGCELVLPRNAAPSTPPRSTIFPIYQWFIVLDVAARGQPALSVRFPITVENESAAQPIKVTA